MNVSMPYLPLNNKMRDIYDDKPLIVWCLMKNSADENLFSLLKCFDDDHVKYILTKLHRRICGMDLKYDLLSTLILILLHTFYEDAGLFDNIEECQQIIYLYLFSLEEIHVSYPLIFHHLEIEYSWQTDFLIVTVDYLG